MASGDAWNAGWNLGSQLAAHRQARKEDLSDKEFGTNFNELQTNIGNLQQQLATFPKGSKKRDEVQQNLAQALEARNSMFAKQPGAMQKFGHLLHLTKAEPTQLPAPPGYQPTLQARGQAAPVKPPRTPGELRARAEAQMMAGAAPAPATAQSDWAKYLTRWHEVMGPGSEPPTEVKEEFARTGKVTEPKPSAESFKTQSLTLPDGRTMTAQQDVKSGRWFYLTGEPIPDDQLQDAKIAAKDLQPKAAWARDQKGKIYSVNLDAKTHQEIPGTRNYNMVPPSSLTGRITTGFFHYVDPATGNVYQVPETHTSVPVGSGRRGSAAPTPAEQQGSAAAAPAVSAAGAPSAAAAAAPSVSKTPKEARRRIPHQPQAPKVAAAGGAPNAPARGAAPRANGPGRVIGWKGTKDYIDTKTAYEAAIDRTRTMDDNLKSALQGDQQAMISLVANHIGMTLGAQKGARINQAIWNEAVESTPWLARTNARFDSRGYLSGVTLAPEQMRQMVQLAHEKMDVLKQHLGRLNAERGVGGAPKTGGTPGALPPGWK
jgi:hypothetical protein